MASGLIASFQINLELNRSLKGSDTIDFNGNLIYFYEFEKQSWFIVKPISLIN